MGSYRVGEASEREGSSDRGSERMATDQGLDHVTDDVESTRLDTANLIPSCSHGEAKISHNLNPVNFEE